MLKLRQPLNLQRLAVGFPHMPTVPSCAMIDTNFSYTTYEYICFHIPGMKI